MVLATRHDSHAERQDKMILHRNDVTHYTGKRAVYRATGFLIPVIIKEIVTEPHFEARLVAIDNIILTYDQRMPKMRTEFSVSAAWDYLRVEEDSWSFAQSGCVWRVIHKEEACEAVLRLCKEKAGLDPDILFQLADRAVASGRKL